MLIRPIRPEDRPALHRFHERLSPASRRARFLSPKPELTAADARYLSEVDGRDHVGLVAAHGADIVGVGRFIRLRTTPDAAEFAIAVADPWQGHGLGGALLRRLAQAALTRDITRFRASALADNAAIMRLIDGYAAASGDPVARDRSGSVIEVEFPLRAGVAPEMISGCAGS